MKDAFEIASAIIASVGTAGAIIVALSSWLGKVWANRILESDRAKYQREIETLKGALQVQIKEQEIKTNVIQIERNKIILDLAPAISKAYGYCYVYAELGEIAQKSGFREEFYLEAQKRSSDSLKHLWDTTRKAEMFLSDDTFEKVNEFQHTLWGLRQQTSDALYDGENDPITGKPLDKRNISEIFKELKENGEREKKILMTEFRNLLGTNPLNKFQQKNKMNKGVGVGGRTKITN